MGGATTFWAPVHRALARWNGANSVNSVPPNAAPSMDFLASGLQDHRLPYNKRGSSAAQPGIVGWYGAGVIVTANLVPAAAGPALLAALANVVSGTPMTLLGATAGGVTVLSSSVPAFFMPTGLRLTAGLCIDVVPSLISFGNAPPGQFHTAFYNRSAYVGRAVSITGVVSTTGGNFLVSGYDIYGYPMSEVIAAAAGVATTNGKKAFKVITSVTPQFTDAHNYSVGLTDIFGFGIYCNVWEATLIRYNGALITAGTGFTAGVTTTATTTTGDVRGTYAVQSATDGVKRLSLSSAPIITALAANPTTGLFGVAQA